MILVLIACGVAVCISSWLIHYPWVTGLHKKCVVITGCDSGFGNALAKSLYNKGVYVFAGCFTEPGASKLSEETGGRLKTFMLDIASSENIERAYVFVSKNLPDNSELWGLVNNAGVMGDVGPVEFMTREDMTNTMNVNCFGTAEMVRVFLPLLKRSKGRIVNTASMVGVVPFTGTYPYSASKYALRGYTEALRHEKAIWGIKVSLVCPALFKTPIVDLEEFKRRYTSKWQSLSPAVRQEYGEEYRQDYIEMTRDDISSKSVVNFSPVIDAYQHALFARCPYARYHPGIVSAIFVNIQRWMPDMLLDRILQGLSNRCLPVALRGP